MCPPRKKNMPYNETPMKGIIMTKIKVTKFVAKVVVGLSTVFVISNVISNNVSPQDKFQKTEVWVGSVVLGMLVSDLAEQYVDRSIDSVMVWYQTTV